MNILVITGSRADFGLLEWPVKLLRENFAVDLFRIWGATYEASFTYVRMRLIEQRPDLMLVLGDRYEILAAATAAHLARIPIAHIGGGDVTEGSYDDAMRDAISRMASIHFVTSTSAMARLSHMGYRNIHLVGNPGIDVIRAGLWKQARPIAAPYVVVSYQPETLDGTNEIAALIKSLPERLTQVFILPNPDRGSEAIAEYIERYAEECAETVRNCGIAPDVKVFEYLLHSEFLNLLAHCEEFIGNSSAMLYEAPELGVKTRMVGKRQRGRTIPWGDGQASQRIVNILKYGSF